MQSSNVYISAAHIMHSQIIEMTSVNKEIHFT